MYVFGRNVAKELLRNRRKINKVYLVNNFKEDEILKLLNEQNINVEYLDKKRIDRLEPGNNQGIILDIEDYKYITEKDMFDNMPDNPFIVILDHLEDTHNFGAIIRTCEAAGVHYIIIPKDRSVKVNSTVMKTSVGAIDNVKIVMVTNLNNCIKKLKDNGIWVVGTDMENSVLYDSIDYKVPICLVIGSEGSLIKKNCDFIARIPMHGKINSLNASVAAGIMIYEVLRQRK